MSEHFCKNCKNGKDKVCKFTGARHDTGIECPSFESKGVATGACMDCENYNRESGYCLNRGCNFRSIEYEITPCDAFTKGKIEPNEQRKT